jgi:hypothetical protein
VRLPKPDHWTGTRFGELLGRALLAIAGTGLLVEALTGGAAIDLWRFLALAALVSGEEYLALAPRGTGAEGGRGALVFGASRARRAVSATTPAILVLALPLLVGLPTAVLLWAVSLVVAVFADYDVVLEVALDPDAVTVRTVRRRLRVEWADVDDDVEMPEPAYLRVHGGPRLRTRVLAAAPATLYWTLRHYTEHPGDRDELAGDRAVARVRDGDLVPASLAARALTLG